MGVSSNFFYFIGAVVLFFLVISIRFIFKIFNKNKFKSLPAEFSALLAEGNVFIKNENIRAARKVYIKLKSMSEESRDKNMLLASISLYHIDRNMALASLDFYNRLIKLEKRKGSL